MSLRAAVYIRQSTTSENTISPTLQRKHVEKFIEEQGWNQVPEIYEDIDVSGKSEVNRPAFLRLKKDYAAEQFDIAVADDFSRFSRNRADAMALLGSMKIATYKEGIPDAEDDFMPALHFLLADKFSKDIGKRWKDAHRLRAEKKLPPHGHQKFGYIKTREGYKLDPGTHLIVKEGYRMYLAGIGFKKISAYWNNSGTTTLRGSHWDKDMVRKTMDNVHYAGLFIYGHEKLPNGDPVLVNGKKVPIILEGAWEPLLSPGEWAAYKDKRAERAKTAPRTKGSDWPFAGYVLCAKCGSVMAKNKSGNNTYLLCNKRRKGNGCEGVTGIWGDVNMSIWSWFGSHLKEWAATMPSFDEESRAADKAVLDAKAAKDAAQANIDTLLSKMITFNLSDAEVAPSLARYRKEREEATETHESALATQALLAPASDAMEILDRAENLSTPEWRNALGKVLAGVVVMPDRSIMLVPRGENITVWGRNNDVK